MAEFAYMVENDYHIKRKPITVRNPQANAIIERVHQTIGNILRTYELHNRKTITKGDIEGILSSVMFAVRATYHTTLQATPMQLVFGRDAILNIKFEANWDYIKKRKQDLIDYNIKRENKKRILYHYQVEDKALLDETKISKAKYQQSSFSGPHQVIQIRNNGTVVLDMGKIIGRVNKNQMFDRLELVAQLVFPNPDPQEEIDRLEKQ
jgi:hypothetical protein